MSARKRVPALVVSGFLGSGKTTLVRHLLADAQRAGRRAAIPLRHAPRSALNRDLR